MGRGSSGGRRAATRGGGSSDPILDEVMAQPGVEYARRREPDRSYNMTGKGTARQAETFRDAYGSNYLTRADAEKLGMDHISTVTQQIRAMPRADASARLQQLFDTPPERRRMTERQSSLAFRLAENMQTTRELRSAIDRRDFSRAQASQLIDMLRAAN